MNRWNRPGYTAWFSIAEIAGLAGDTVDNIQGFIREDRIPYAVFSDGILIWLYGFQECMNDLYDLAGFVNDLYTREHPDV